MDRIIIQDLTVHFHIGVPAQERANPQRLTLSAEIEYDFSRLADELGRAVDYYTLSQRMLDFGGSQYLCLPFVAAPSLFSVSYGK